MISSTATTIAALTFLAAIGMASTKTSIELLLLVFFSSEFLFLETVKFSSGNDSHRVSCLEIERKALLKFKAALTDPLGQLSSWTGNDCCSWDGVVCNNRSGNVIRLKLSNQYSSNSADYDDYGTANALSGEISTSLLDLKYLNYLDLSMNSFGYIPIPDFFGSLERLRYLNLSGASFTGPIPPLLGNLSRLRYLDLSSNFMESTDIQLNWLSGLSSLKHLSMASVNLSNAAAHWLDVVNLLPSLSELHLPSCELTNFPLSLPHLNLTSLLALDLSNNGFNSTLPSWLFNLSSLVYLDLSSNNLQGEVDTFSRLTFLEHLDLSQNIFAGKLSKRFGTLCNLRMLDISLNSFSGEINEFINGLAECTNSRLETLHLQYNKLTGSLPESLGYLRSLKSLLIMHNSVSGSIPESIGNLSSLQELLLSYNQIKGSIPVSFGQLSSLVSLDTQGNQFEGIITEAHFANLTSLKELTIMQPTTNITLAFSISPSWIPPFKLTYLELKSCLVGPKFPEWLRNQNMLSYLAVWRTNISGSIPTWFWELDLFLERLDFSYNQLTGTVPSTIRFREQAVVFLNYNNFRGPLPIFLSNVTSYHLDNNFLSGPIPLDFGERLPFLVALDLSYNSLNGTIPLSMSRLSSVMTFVLASNYLTGEIPEFWNYMPYVYVVDVSNNSLSGIIPTSLGFVTGLKFLKLSNNKLSGEVPSALANCTELQTLDLGENELSGKIPAWIGEKLPSLLIISLRSNSFTGEIPSNLCSLFSLHILDLAQNNFSGRIPTCIGNLSGMTTVLDSMRYEGQLWVVAKSRTYFYDGTLYLVNSIDLSGNNLVGEMPSGFTSASRLGTLNLSMNHLTGKIPADIGNLRSLETLDLSSNNLSGIIPPSMASITSLNHLDLTYNNLSGKIPTTNQFSTFGSSTYEGNPALCGTPLSTKCIGDKDETSQPLPEGENDDEDKDEHGIDMFWFYIGIAPGFAVGFWVVCGTLIIKKSWRQAYFRFIDDKKDSFLLIFSITLARLRKFFKRKDT
ncbi:serine/threonine-protein kinase bri1, putative [Ricinus communis]|uniref:Serine/threonine-protein kinase bri1, putative n=1 Tax=Ricinus communis TaxID=3988 RepID=B9RM78_RICCO|nr:serine/threonine-protein kinase bri1, putative [Ricinus communis]|eukprot:XP_025012370.1 receptor-like protein EIX1 [Ricinus communis]